MQSPMPDPDEPGEIARGLRTLADRIEDGEYVTNSVSLRPPSTERDDINGHFKIELCTIEDFRQMEAIYGGGESDAE